MSTIIETTVYAFDELSEEAKEKARNWLREGNCEDSFWHECVIDDAKECGKIIGIDIDHIYFRGFWSQGDGACFEGSYRYQKGAAKAIRAHAPQDKELHAIADRLQATQRPAFYGLTAAVKHHGHYYHEHCTTIDVHDADGYNVGGDSEEDIMDILRDFMRWIYKRLEAEWEYQNADEQVDESIRINEYTFTEEGERA